MRALVAAFRTLAPALAVVAAAPAAVAAAVVLCGAHCPDLVVDPFDTGNAELSEEVFPPTHCAVVEGLVAPGARTLLRFPLTTANVGLGDVALGRPADHPDWFTASACHGHDHFDGFADYRLWTPEAYVAWTTARAEDPSAAASDVLAAHPELADGLARGRKQGFCLMDSHGTLPIASRYPTCGYQGLSSGWKDRYDSFLDGQWIDVTGLPEGDYVLEVETNAERRIEEDRYENNVAAQLVFVG